jgi:hypothetical protein
MYDVAMLLFAAIAAIGAVIAVLPLFGFDLRIIGRPKKLTEVVLTRPMRKAWVALVVALLSVGLSAGAFYYFFRPRLVQKIVEKPIDRTVPCPQQETQMKPLSPAKPPRSSERQKANVPTTTSTAPQQPPQPSQSCPNGICIAGDNSGTATVNNFGPPPIHLDWTISDVVPPGPVPILAPGATPQTTFAYEKQIVLTPSGNYSPVSIGVICGTRIREVRGSLRNGMAALNVRMGVDPTGKNAYVYFEGSPATHGNPLIIKLWADDPITITDIKEAKLAGIND